MNFWLVKSEPPKYSWPDLCKDGVTIWDGVRNHQAQNYLKAMKLKDQVLFYHSNTKDKGGVGVAEVIKQAFPDPTNETWTAVEIKPLYEFKRIVSLQELKTTAALSGLLMLKQPRLSVMPVLKSQFEIITRLGKIL